MDAGLTAGVVSQPLASHPMLISKLIRIEAQASFRRGMAKGRSYVRWRCEV